MKYMGSKNRIAKHLIPIMVAEADKIGITTWVEPFVGGANLIDKVPNRFKRIGYDINEHVIMALIDIRDNVDSLPESVSEDYYKSLKGTPPTTITSWIRFVCSFGGKFENGYARQGNSLKYKSSPTQEGKRNALKQSPKIQGIEFIHDSYENLIFENSLVYCDIPYKSTTSYKTSPLDYEHFYQWCVEQCVKGNIVFISEYEMPEQLEYNGKVYKFEFVWRGEVKTNFASNRKQATHNAVEKLFKVIECK